MDSIKQTALQIKRHEVKLRESRRQEYLAFESSIEVLQNKQTPFLIVPLDLEFGQAHSVNGVLSKFQFDGSGQLVSDEIKSHAEWRELSVIKSSSSAIRVFVVWSSQSFSVDIVLKDLDPYVEELCADYCWHSYIVDPVAGWVVEFHSGGLARCQSLIT